MTSIEERVKNRDLTREPSEQSLLIAMGIGWLVPGLGHIYMQRYRRGLVFLASIVALFVSGLILCQWTYTTRADFPFYLIGKYGSGLVFFGQYLLTETGAIDLSVHFHYFEIGVLFLSVAGLLNTITILNLVDVKMGRSLLLEMQEDGSESGEASSPTEQEDPEAKSTVQKGE